MSFSVFYKIKNNKLVYVGLAEVKDSKNIKFESYELCIIFEDKLIRLMHSNSYVTEKIIKRLVKEVYDK